MQRDLILFIACALAIGAPTLCSQDMIGVAWDGSAYHIDSAAGTTTPLGNTGYASLNSMARDPFTGILYAAAGSQLISIDPATGAGTPATTLTASSIRGMTFSPTGILYIIEDSTYDRLWSYNPSTTLETNIGNTNHSGLQALACSLSGTLFAYDVAPNTSSTGAGLVTVDPLTAASTDVNPAISSTTLQSIQALCLSPEGVLYGGGYFYSFPGPSYFELYTIDSVSGALTLVGSSGGTEDIRGLEFLPLRLRIRGMGAPGSYVVGIDLIFGTPGLSYATVITTNPGNYPNGAILGIDPTWIELFVQLSYPYPPFNGILDGTGCALFSLPLAGPVGVTVYGVSVEHSGGLILGWTPPTSATI